MVPSACMRMLSIIRCPGRSRAKTWRLVPAICLVCVMYWLRSRFEFETDTRGDNVAPQISSSNEVVRYLSLKDTEDADVLDNLHQYKFSINSQNCRGRLSVVAIVHTAMYHVKKRQKIRQTLRGSSEHGSLLTVVFFVGQTINASLQAEVKRESKEYRDIVQGNFIDSYHNLTHKHMMGYHWVLTYCKHVRYVIKMDDDVVLHTNNVLRYLLSNPVPDGNILCFLIVHSKRQKKGKWNMSKKEYPFHSYPPYCGGFAYITTLPVIKMLYDTSAHIKSIWIDDAYATGILALASNTTLQALPKGTRF
ncbi:beta-1,3-galactosyltransferase 1-like isoform X2 [Haliotis rubra]|uniref:beta-1,3-galactosyltransferase 1-like isoform X2 n=1 Tax=Haliotis rubra TaxID=36100 RepID=UPI001EE5A7A4|nr:beta-1,3-galactosyltransferase 1-like isoform X2 [Haliotis rubra]